MRATNLALLATAGLTLTTSVRGDVVKAEWTSATDFDYRIEKMPDVDQLRDALFDVVGLPGGGASHCGPSSVMNLLGYIARHGLPELAPGFINYRQPDGDTYNAVSIALDDLGTVMGTTPEDGTTGTGMYDGTLAWLQQSGVDDKLVHAWWFAAGSWSPKTSDMALQAINGSLVGFCYGRYTITGSCNGNKFGTRDSGHCVTLVEAHAFGGARVNYRDPVSSDSTFLQDEFAETSFVTTNDNYSNNCTTRKMSRFAGPFSDGRERIIDGMMTIRPKGGFAFTPTEAFKVNPYILEGMGGFGLATFMHTHGAGVHDLVPDPDALHLFSIEQDSPASGACTLLRRNMVTGAQEAIAVLPAAGRLAFGRGRELYCLSGGELRCYDVDAETPVLVAVLTGVCGDSIAYDDATDEVVVICLATREVVRYGRELASVGTTRTIPARVPLAGFVRHAVRRSSPSLLLACATGGLHRLDPDSASSYTATEIPCPGVDEISSVSEDDAGHLFICADGAVKELAPDEAGGWAEVVDSPFAGTPACGFTIDRSRTNFDPALHGDWRFDVAPDQDEIDAGTIVLDCDADLDDDGDVGFGDLLLLVAGWGECDAIAPCIADLDENDAVDFADLLALLGAWGPCP